MATGTGTAGSNQNGAVPTGPYGSPGEILSVAGPLSQNANVPVVDKDFSDLFVTDAYDLGIKDAARPNLILDQFATEKASNLTHNGDVKRIRFMDDLVDATTPLLENIDVDKVALSGRTVNLTQRQYGNALQRTELLENQSMVPWDPIAARKAGWNAGSTLDTLAKNAFFATTLAMYTPSDTALTGSVGLLAPTLSNGSAGYLSTDVLQEGIVMLGEKNAEPYMNDQYVLLIGPRGAQHLKAESNAGGWRDVVMRAEAGRDGGNDIFRGYIGNYEGTMVVVSRHLTAGKALLFGAEAFAKTFPGVNGAGAMPSAVVSPVTDSLRRFAGIGWKWTGGYSLFRPQNVIQITHTTGNRPLAATNNAIGATAYAEA